MNTALSELLTPDEVIQILRIDLRTLYRLLKEGRIPAVKVGGRWRFRTDELTRWLESRSIKIALPSKRILVVHRQEAARQHIVRAILEDNGNHYVVDSVRDGQSALSELERVDFDLMLLHLALRDIDGMQLVERARVLSPALKVIVMAENPTLESAVQAANLGVNGYVPASVRNNELLSRVHLALGEHATSQKPGSRNAPRLTKQPVQG